MDFNRLTQETFEAIQRIFPCEEDLKDKVPLEKIVMAFQDKLVSQDHPFCIRIAGQSGSGKSSQLLPAVEQVLKGTPYLKISVGDFARFHPAYADLMTTNPGHMREITNGFALRALFMFYTYCVEHKVNILLDMTLLEPVTETYMMTLAKNKGYRIHTHVLCVPKKVSDMFIKWREKKTKRQVDVSSARYFFNALPKALKTLTALKIFTQADKLILWTHTLSRPLKMTGLSNKAVGRLLGQYRCGPKTIKNPKELLKHKHPWMRNLVWELVHV